MQRTVSRHSTRTKWVVITKTTDKARGDRVDVEPGETHDQGVYQVRIKRDGEAQSTVDYIHLVPDRLYESLLAHLGVDLSRDIPL